MHCASEAGCILVNIMHAVVDARPPHHLPLQGRLALALQLGLRPHTGSNYQLTTESS